ncbi:MAG: zinc ABC transporter substrate-binding protein [Desulfosarcinaceae bacterium]|nr:zinc ABC transporter substrate-binding protein [Desulfosarcinaceae bacterium]
MYRLTSFISIIVVGVSLSWANCFAADKLPVFVTIAPQKYFVQQIGKDLVDVQVMVHPGADPHTYEPKPQQMVAISKAQLYFAVGIEFEHANLKKITATNPNLMVIHTDHGIEKLAMAVHDHHEEGHAEEHHQDAHAEEDHHDEPAEDHHESEHHEAEHAHEKDDHHAEAEHPEDHHEHTGLDPHIWLSPPLVKIQARTILAALQDADPAHRDDYAANFNAFMARIDQLDADLKKTFAGQKGLQFMVFHPSWGYFAHAYGLKQVPIEVEGKDPKAAQLQALIQHAREDGIKVIFVQPQFSAASAQLVAKEIGGQVAFADPLAEDWMANLREVAGKFQMALK